MANELTTIDFQQLDQLDEQQIVAELQGALLDQYVYSFQSGGRNVVGLSWAGVKAVANKLGPVTCDLLELRDTDESYICVVKASAPDGTQRIGAAEQAKMLKNKPDSFALPKAISKAQRNAIRALLPETLITEMVKAYRGQSTTPRQPTNGKLKTNEPARWTHDANTVARMFDEAKKIGLSQADVHLALLVEDVRDFTGTKAEGWKMIETYAKRKNDIPL